MPSNVVAGPSDAAQPAGSFAPETPVFPASFAQERLWFLHQLEPGVAAYNIPVGVRLTGRLDARALEESLNEIVKRHDLLRTAFPVRQGVPVQVISGALTLPLSEVDLRGMAASVQPREVSRLALAEAEAPFDLARAPLLRAKRLRLSEEEEVLLLTMHHIVSDGWSVETLFGELSALYEAFSRGKPSPLAELPIQYADYALWQRGWLRGEALEAELSYWREQLAGAPDLLELPADRSRPGVQSFRGASRSAALPAALFEGLQALSRREGTTLFMTLLAAFDALLSRLSGQEDILVGSPIAGRNRVETEGLIGFFVNTLILRGDVSGDPTFLELLGRMREAALGAYSHQDLPFERLVEELRPRRSLAYAPLFQVMFQLVPTAPRTVQLAGLRSEEFPIENRIAKFDLSLTMMTSPSGLTCAFKYNTDLFDAETIDRWIGYFQVLLEGIVEDPERRVSRLPLLTEPERRQILVEWNGTEREYRRDRCLHELVAAQSARTPERVALVWGGQRVSYAELNRRSDSLARYLRGLGVGRGVLVGVSLERSVEMVVGLLGVLKAGGAYVPLDPAYPRERVELMLKDSGAPVVLTQEKLSGSLPAGVRAVCLDTEWERIEREGEESVPGGVDAGDLAYVIYTSGSTGRPKGVAIEHRSAVNLVDWAGEVYGPEELAGVFASTSICFDLSVFEMFVPLSWGGSVILGGHALELRGLPAASEVTLVNTVPSAMAELVRLEALPTSVRTVNLAGEPLSARLVEQIYSLGTVGKVYDLYGPSEATTYSTFALREAGGPETIGRPIANTRVYLLDARGEPVPVRVVGEVYIGGEGLARGYLNRPELTQERFLPDPFDGDGSRLYRTGDLARYLPDGKLEFLGRRDHQVKVRGYRIELGEIEAALSAHPGVRESVVVSREDIPGEKRLVAYLAVDRGREPTVTDLRRSLQKTLPDYMVPAAFVLLEDLPLSPSGKVDRRALPAPEAVRAPAFEAPRDAFERQLVEIWERYLRVKPVGISDNFFELGGHSLLAVRVFAEIENLVGRKLPLAMILQGPTVGELAAALRQEKPREAWSSLVPIQPEGTKPPLYCVHAVGGNVLTYYDLAKYLSLDQPVYGLQVRGLDGKQPRHSRVEDMAADYIREIRARRPEGPYHLGGSSGGGMIAFEMARQLRAQGAEVGVVALFDTHGPDYKRLPGQSRLQLRLSYTLQRIDLHISNLVAASPKEKLAYLKEKSQRWKRRIKKRRRKAERERLPADLRDARNATHHALATYVPLPYDGNVTLFRAIKQPRGFPPDPHMGWGRVALGGVEVYEVPGHHGAIVHEPRIRLLAERLQACLERAGAERANTAPRVSLAAGGAGPGGRSAG